MMPKNNFDMVLFGATGDLAMRKLLPSLYHAHAEGLLHPQARILGVSRSVLDTAAYIAKVEQDARVHIGTHDPQVWQDFLSRIIYQSVDVTCFEHFEALAKTVHSRTETDSIVVYLSTSPQFFAETCRQLAAVGLNGDNVRIVLEKPLGTDLASSQQINTDVGRFFREEQIYRIDHYLGKESLQNLLPLRFANVWFEPIWNNQYIRSVQITIAETLGVEERGEFYERTGALRDMVQNHMVQMLCFTAMERPVSLNADAIRNEKLKVVQALSIMSPQDVDRYTVRAQYAAADDMNGYTNELNVAKNSQTETFVAIEAHIDNERWAGVPFYLRTGKRMAAKIAEIVVDFKSADNGLFGSMPNRLTIRLQPDETVGLSVLVKQTGKGLDATSAEMVLDLGQAVAGRRASAYELLLREVIDGRLALFNRRDELEAAWAWATPILTRWAQTDAPVPCTYAAGSWGPDEARQLLHRNGDRWAEEA